MPSNIPTQNHQPAAAARPGDELHARSKSPAFTPVPRVTPSSDGRTGVLPGTPHTKEPDPDFGNGVIDQRRYTSPEFMTLEWERLWTKVWLVAGRALDIPNPGDYLVTELGVESIIAVRQADGGVRAFYNVCQHRGNRLRPCGRGSAGAAQSFKCLYHHWEYNLDGSYRRIPDLDTFPQGAPSHGLTEIKCEVWGSFVWFSMNPDAPPLAEFLAPIPRHLDPYHFERIYGCHIKTFRGKDQQVPLGQGDFDFRSLAASIKQTKWTGWLITEEGGNARYSGLAAVGPDRTYIRKVFGV